MFSAGKVRSSVDTWYSTRQKDFHIFVADVVKSFDTVDRKMHVEILPPKVKYLGQMITFVDQEITEVQPGSDVLGPRSPNIDMN